MLTNFTYEIIENLYPNKTFFFSVGRITMAIDVLFFVFSFCHNKKGTESSTHTNEVDKGIQLPT